MHGNDENATLRGIDNVSELCSLLYRGLARHATLVMFDTAGSTVGAGALCMALDLPAYRGERFPQLCTCSLDIVKL